jgi:hypothetical protein
MSSAPVNSCHLTRGRILDIGLKLSALLPVRFALVTYLMRSEMDALTLENFMISIWSMVKTKFHAE